MRMTARLGGLAASLLTVVAILRLGNPALSNLPLQRALLSRVAVGGVAAIVAYLAGSAACRRALRGSGHVPLFSATAGAVAGGMIGGISALALTAAYFTTYMAWPADRVQEILVVLFYPAFASLGVCLGAAAGFVLGFLGGGALRIVTFRRYNGLQRD